MRRDSGLCPIRHGGPALLSRQAGFTLLELLIVVAVSALLATSLAMNARHENRKLYGQKVGNSYKPFMDALQAYVTRNKQTLLLSAQQGISVSGTAQPLAPTIAELKNLGLFSSSYAITLPSNGGTPLFKIELRPAGCSAATCELAYWVANNKPELGVDGLADEGVLAVAAKTFDAHAEGGATAGYSKSLTPAKITASQGQFAELTNPNGSVAGIFAVFNTSAPLGSSAFVELGDTRNTELNGALTVAGAGAFKSTLSVAGDGTFANNLTVAGSLTVARTGEFTGDLSTAGALSAKALTLKGVVVEGGNCSIGQIATGSEGQLMSCQDGVWAKQGAKLAASGVWYLGFECPNPSLATGMWVGLYVNAGIPITSAVKCNEFK